MTAQTGREGDAASHSRDTSSSPPARPEEGRPGMVALPAAVDLPRATGRDLGALEPLDMLRQLRQAEMELQAREIQVAALKAMKKREEQTKLIESRARDTLSRHLDAWRRVVVDARAARALEHKDAQIERLAQRVRDMGGRVTPRYS